MFVIVITPIITPNVIIKGARIFMPLEKFGSTDGTVKIQLVIAPPMIARVASTLTLIICVVFSDEYWEDGLDVGNNMVYIENRVE